LNQRTVTRELKAIQEGAFSRAFDSLYVRCKRWAEAGRTILSDGNTTIFYLLCVVFVVSVLEINCYTVYAIRKVQDLAQDNESMWGFCKYPSGCIKCWEVPE
jgi:hypothetical protein